MFRQGLHPNETRVMLSYKQKFSWAECTMRRREALAAASGIFTGLAVVNTDSTSAGQGGPSVSSDTIPNPEVWTHRGRRVRFYDDLVRDRVVILNVMYTGCGYTCPLVTQNLLAVQELLADRIGRDLFIYSLSLQPELETPALLADYATQHGIAPGWELLTGRPAELARLRDSLGFRSADPEAAILLDEHTGMLRYGSDALDRWAHLPALLPPESIAKALRGSVLLG